MIQSVIQVRGLEQIHFVLCNTVRYIRGFSMHEMCFGNLMILNTCELSCLMHSATTCGHLLITHIGCSHIHFHVRNVL